MDYNFYLPQTIGLNSGTTHDGALLGNFPGAPYTGFVKESYNHEVDYGVLYGNVLASTEETWLEIQDNLNDLTSQELFDPGDPMGTPPQYDYTALYFSVRDDTTDFLLNCTTPGVGDAVFIVEYNSPTGYVELTGATLSANFLTSSGTQTLTLGTHPTNWQDDFIGVPSIPRQKWVRIRIVSGSFSTTPVVEGAWQSLSTLEPNISPLIPAHDGDITYYSTTYKPTIMKFVYTDPMEGAHVTFQYSKQDGSVVDIPNIIDTSEGFTASNSIEAELLTVEQIVPGITIIESIERLTGDCYVEASGSGLPSVSLNNWQIILNIYGTSTDVYGWSSYESGGNYFYYAVKNGSEILYTSPAFSSEEYSTDLRLFRFNTGPSDSLFFLKGAEILFQVSGIDRSSPAGMGCASFNDGTIVTGLKFVDFSSSRKSFPIALTFSSTTGVTITPVLTTQNYPAYYYISFETPADLTYLPAELSHTGIAGYNLAVKTIGTPTQNVELSLSQYIGTDYPLNTLVKTVNDGFFRYSNLTISEDNFETFTFDTLKFLIIIKKDSTSFSKIATFTQDTQEMIYTYDFSEKISTNNIGMLQINGELESWIGYPSKVSFSS